MARQGRRVRFGEEPASYSSDGALGSGPSEGGGSVRRRRGLRRTKSLNRRGKVSETTSHMLQRMSGVLEKLSQERASQEGRALHERGSLEGPTLAQIRSEILPAGEPPAAQTAPSPNGSHSADVPETPEGGEGRAEGQTHSSPTRPRPARDSSEQDRDAHEALQELCSTILRPIGEPEDFDDRRLLASVGPGTEQQLPPCIVAVGESQKVPRFRIRPDGVFRTAWDATAALLTYAVTLWIPLLIAYFDSQDQCLPAKLSGLPSPPSPPPPPSSLAAFQPQTTTFSGSLVLYLVDFFFLVDIGLNFLTGVKTQDPAVAVDYHLASIATSYLSSWFWIDAIACIPLDCLVFTTFGAPPSYSNIARVTRLLRLIGINRRTNGGPFSWLQRLLERKGQWNNAAVNLTTVLFHSVLIVHWAGCLYWYSARWTGFVPQSWPAKMGLGNKPWAEWYLWSVFAIVSAMAGLGYGPVSPGTTAEAATMLVMMMVTASLFVTITSLIFAFTFSNLNRRRQYSEAMDRVMSVVNSMEGLPPALKTRIISSVRERYRSSAREMEDSVEMLTESVKTDFALFNASDLVRVVPILSRSDRLLSSICLLLRYEYVLPQSQLLHALDPVEATHFIRSGWVRFTTLDYSLGYSGPGGHFGEVSLLDMPSLRTAQSMGLSTVSVQRASRNWLCVETLTAVEVMRLPRDQFHEVIASFAVTQNQLRRAALQRVRLFDDEGISNLLTAMEKAYRRRQRAAQEAASSLPLLETHGCWHPARWAHECERWGQAAWRSLVSCKWERPKEDDKVAPGSEAESE